MGFFLMGWPFSENSCFFSRKIAKKLKIKLELTWNIYAMTLEYGRDDE